MLIRSIARLTPALLLAATGLAQAQCYYTSQMVAGDPQNNAFGGVAVAVDGQYILSSSTGRNAGAGTNSGEVYCYAPISNSWSQVAHILPSTLAGANNNFGSSVGIGGGALYAVVGAPGYSSNAGLAYIFKRNTQTNLWSQVTALTPGFNNGAKFGSSVAMNTQGNIAVIGAPYADITDLFGTTAGAGDAGVYVLNGSTWTFEFSLHQYDASIRHTNDFYGYSVGIDGSVAVVGCRSGDSPTHTDCGYINIWERNAALQWTANGEVFAPDEATSDYFGTSVAISGAIVVVGAPGASHLGMADAGCAYVYRKINGSWVYQTILHATDASLGANFGEQVSIYGDNIVIGTNSSTQKAYLFRRTSGDQWVQDARYNNPGAAGDGFSGAVAMGPTFFVSGAWGFDTPNYGQMGATYIYDVPTGQSDTCAGAWPVFQGTTTGCTNICTVDGYSSCGTGGAGGVGPDAWFSYTAPATGTVTIDTQGSSFDTVLSVHSGCPGDVASMVSCNDDNSYPAQLWSRVHMQVGAGQTFLIRVAGYNGLSGAFNLNISPVNGCYANCDGGTTAPVLNVLDFSCFLNKFAAGDPYANCDGSTTVPVLNVNDFSCFLNKFAAGCS